LQKNRTFTPFGFNNKAVILFKHNNKLKYFKMKNEVRLNKIELQFNLFIEHFFE
jgi:hypothetical protein